MKHLLPTIQSLGPVVGVVLCTVVFIAIVAWAYRPGSKRIFDQAGKMPLDD